MSTFEKSSWGWQISQMQQRVLQWWEWQVSRFNSNLPEASLPDWLTSPLLWRVVQIVFWAIAILLIVWTGWQIWQRLRPYIHSLGTQIDRATKATTTSGRELSVADWLQRSQKFQSAGNYQEACRCLYFAMLQRLNDREIVPLEFSRTDGEYLRLIQQLPQPQPYRILLDTHQRLFFGKGEASRAVFEQCQQAYREIEVL
jgi:hypothetical protein